MKRAVFAISIVLGMWASSCIPGRPVVKTHRLSDTIGSTVDWVYGLPRTAFEVKVYYELVRKIKGPYAAYADKYLGITRVTDRNERWWQITDIHIRSFTEPDPSQIYGLQNIQGQFNPDPFTHLSRQGLILHPGEKIWAEAHMDQPALSDLVDPAWFTDLSVKRNLQEKTDTLYKTVLTDSSFIRIPVLKKQIVAKTTEEKAEEAANFLIKLRKRRFKLMSGQYEVYPEGTALETAVRELNALEEEYLSLFIGKTIKDSYVRSFIVVPVVEGTIDLAWFSLAGGMMDRRTSEAERLQFKIGVDDALPVSPRISPKENTLFYRMPVPTAVSVNLGSEVRAVARTQVYQLGPVIPYLMK